MTQVIVDKILFGLVIFSITGFPILLGMLYGFKFYREADPDKKEMLKDYSLVSLAIGCFFSIFCIFMFWYLNLPKGY